MSITTLRQIKDLIRDEGADNLHQLADDLVPIYYSDLVQEWIELPIDHRDTWEPDQALGQTSITNLMAIDLYNYYYKAIEQVYYDLKREQG
jgi:hypothetical protein